MCVRIYMYACTCAWISACLEVCIYVMMHAMNTHLCVCIYICTYEYGCVRMFNLLRETDKRTYAILHGLVHTVCQILRVHVVTLCNLLKSSTETYCNTQVHVALGTADTSKVFLHTHANAVYCSEGMWFRKCVK